MIWCCPDCDTDLLDEGFDLWCPNCQHVVTFPQVAIATDGDLDD